MTKHIGVVVVTYFAEGEIAACLKSIAAQHIAHVKITAFVSDNGSTDKTRDIATAHKAVVTANGKNLGFSKAVNVGVKAAYKHGCDTILVLNPDAALKPNALKLMLDVLNSSDDIGGVGPTMLHGDGSPANVGYYLKAPTWLTVTLFSTFLRPWALKHPKFVARYEETDFSSTREVEQIPGACLLVTKKHLDDIGFLDEDFVIWFEDVEWCYRARKKGYRLLVCPEAEVLHEGGVSFDRWKSFEKAVTFYVSMRTFFRKAKPFSLPFVICSLCCNALVVYVKNHDRDQLRFIKRLLIGRPGRLPNS